jgi:GNAT superfamily N-acetyltransferase
MSNLVIRQAEEKDVPLIFNLIKELAEFERLLHEVKATEESLTETLFGARRYAEVLLAEINGEAVGQALFFHNYSTFIGKPGIYLEDLYIRPAFRGKGYGKALLLKIIEIARSRNCGRVEWAVLNWNSSAIDFYKSLGAVPMQEWHIFRLTEDKF